MDKETYLKKSLGDMRKDYAKKIAEARAKAAKNSGLFKYKQKKVKGKKPKLSEIISNRMKQIQTQGENPEAYFPNKKVTGKK